MTVLQNDHLNGTVSLVNIAGTEPGWVQSQSVAPGTPEKWGTTVVLYVQQPNATSPPTTLAPVSGISGVTP
jgi:hypothetical protein